MLTDLQQRLHSIQSVEMPVEQAYGLAKRSRSSVGKAISTARYHCPICDRWYSRFAPFGLRGRRNARCPGCGSLERHRFLWLYMIGRQRILRPGCRILHVAPEACIQKRLKTRLHVKYLGIDRYDDDANAEQQDLTDLPYPKNAFDLVICNHVLEHIPDDRKAISEIARVLHPSGHALIMVPVDRSRYSTYEDHKITSPSDRHEAFGHPYHVRICGWDYADRISSVGMRVLQAHSNHLPEHRRRINRINKTVLYDCTLQRN